MCSESGWTPIAPDGAVKWLCADTRRGDVMRHVIDLTTEWCDGALCEYTWSELRKKGWRIVRCYVRGGA